MSGAETPAEEPGRPRLRPSRRRVLALGVGLAAAAIGRRPEVGAAITPAALPASLYFPPSGDDTWERATAENAGWDSSGLQQAVEWAGDYKTNAVLVLYRGRIVLERYWNNWGIHAAAPVASAQKSVTAVLAGIAQAQGLLRIEDPVSQYLGEGWSQAPASNEVAITMRHLLTQTSGLTDALTVEADPGTLWRYNTDAYYRAKAVIQQAAGTPFSKYMQQVLGGPIGMQDSSWNGELLGAPPGQQLSASARDLGRFGLLVEAGGNWDGTAIMTDTDYLANALRPSQPLNQAYGYLWWLNGSASHMLPGVRATLPGPIMPDAPADMVLAWGAADKLLYVVPGIDAIVVRHGGDTGMGFAQGRQSFANRFWQKLTAARLTG